MSEIIKISFDESGYTGQQLLDPDQIVYCLASVQFKESEACDFLNIFADRTQGEYKYSKLKKAKRNQQLFLTLLNDIRLHSSSCKLYAIHKPFMVVSKIIDNIYEPLAHEDGIDFYKDRAALAFANMFTSIFPTYLGNTRYLKFLNFYSLCCREKTQDSFDRFYKEAHQIYSFLEKKHPDASSTFAPIIYACKRGVSFFVEPITKYNHDPTIPAYYMLINAWNMELDSFFEILADDSNVLKAEHSNLMKLANPNLNPITLNHYDAISKYPLKISKITTADSHTYSSIQLADIIAGIGSQVLSRLAQKLPLSEFEKHALDILLKKELILGQVWPSADVTPQQLGAEGDYDENPLHYIFKVLSDDPSVLKS